MINRCGFPPTSNRKYQPKSSCSGSPVVTPCCRNSKIRCCATSSPNEFTEAKYGRTTAVLKASDRNVTTVRRGIHSLDVPKKKAGCGKNRTRLKDRQETQPMGPWSNGTGQ